MIAEERARLPGIALTTRVLRSGAGAPVLLLHGSPDTAEEWLPLMEALGTECACIAPDLPGLGECDEPPPSFDYTRAATARFIDELLEVLDVKERAVIVVHDIGGVIGIPWAASHPERIRGVVITNTVVFERFPWFGPAKIWARTGLIGRTLASAMMWQVGWFRGRIFRRAFKRISPELSSKDLDRMTHQFACDPKSKRSTIRLFRQMVPDEYFAGFGAMMRSLIDSVPVRVVWGRGDPYIPARYADELAGAEREIVERGGHWIPLSATERVAAAVRGVLATEPRPRRR
jgi:pimeloyl-ACP methyl ester carboxylesterase